MNKWNVAWTERVDAGQITREAIFRDVRIEVTAPECGTAGDFAGSFRLIPQTRGETSRHGPYWAKSAIKALDDACKHALDYVDSTGD